MAFFQSSKPTYASMRRLSERGVSAFKNGKNSESIAVLKEAVQIGRNIHDDDRETSILKAGTLMWLALAEHGEGIKGGESSVVGGLLEECLLHLEEALNIARKESIKETEKSCLEIMEKIRADRLVIEHIRRKMEKL